jgi:hypothetical protein
MNGLGITIPLYNEWLATSLWSFTNEWLATNLWSFTNEWLGITIPLDSEWLATEIWFSVPMNGYVSLFLWTVNG